LGEGRAPLTSEAGRKLSAVRVLLSVSRDWLLAGFTIMRTAFGKKKTSTTTAKRVDADSTRISPAVAGAWAGPAPSAPPEVQELLQRIKMKLREF